MARRQPARFVVCAQRHAPRTTHTASTRSTSPAAVVVGGSCALRTLAHIDGVGRSIDRRSASILLHAQHRSDAHTQQQTAFGVPFPGLDRPGCVRARGTRIVDRSLARRLARSRARQSGSYARGVASQVCRQRAPFAQNTPGNDCSDSQTGILVTSHECKLRSKIR